jgi:hypothetical protein
MSLITTVASIGQRRIVAATFLSNAVHDNAFSTVWQHWGHLPGTFDLIIDFVRSESTIKMASAKCFGNGEFVGDHLRKK